MSGATLNRVLSDPNWAADRIEALEAALWEVLDAHNKNDANEVARAVLPPEPWPQDAIDQEMIERTDDGWSHRAALAKDADT